MADLSLRGTSKTFCGNRYLLEVAASIHDYAGDDFTAMRVAEATGIHYQRVFEVFQRLERGGVIRRVRKGLAGVDFKAEPSPFWEFARAFVDERGT